MSSVLFESRASFCSHSVRACCTLSTPHTPNNTAQHPLTHVVHVRCTLALLARTKPELASHKRVSSFRGQHKFQAKVSGSRSKETCESDSPCRPPTHNQSLAFLLQSYNTTHRPPESRVSSHRVLIGVTSIFSINFTSRIVCEIYNFHPIPVDTHAH